MMQKLSFHGVFVYLIAFTRAKKFISQTAYNLMYLDYNVTFRIRAVAL